MTKSKEAILSLSHVMWNLVLPHSNVLELSTIENVDLLISLGEALFPMARLVCKTLQSNTKWAHPAALEAYSIGAWKIGRILFDDHIALMVKSKLKGNLLYRAIQKYTDHAYTTAALHCPFSAMDHITIKLKSVVPDAFINELLIPYAFVSACEHGNLDVVRHLFPVVGGQPDPDLPFSILCHGCHENGFGVASQNGQLEIVQFLLNNLKIVDCDVAFTLQDEEPTIKITTLEVAFDGACVGGHLSTAKFIHSKCSIGHKIIKGIVKDIEFQNSHIAQDVLKWLVFDVLHITAPEAVKLASGKIEAMKYSQDQMLPDSLVSPYKSSRFANALDVMLSRHIYHFDDKSVLKMPQHLQTIHEYFKIVESNFLT
jgi:hypothetical protein